MKKLGIEWTARLGFINPRKELGFILKLWELGEDGDERLMFHDKYLLKMFEIEKRFISFVQKELVEGLVSTLFKGWSDDFSTRRWLLKIQITQYLLRSKYLSLDKSSLGSLANFIDIEIEDELGRRFEERVNRFKPLHNESEILRELGSTRGVNDFIYMSFKCFRCKIDQGLHFLGRRNLEILLRHWEEIKSPYLSEYKVYEDLDMSGSSVFRETVTNMVCTTCGQEEKCLFCPFFNQHYCLLLEDLSPGLLGMNYEPGDLRRRHIRKSRSINTCVVNCLSDEILFGQITRIKRRKEELKEKIDLIDNYIKKIKAALKFAKQKPLLVPFMDESKKKEPLSRRDLIYFHFHPEYKKLWDFLKKKRHSISMKFELTAPRW